MSLMRDNWARWGLTAIRVGRAIRFRVRDIEAWLERNEISKASCAGKRPGTLWPRGSPDCGRSAWSASSSKQIGRCGRQLVGDTIGCLGAGGQRVLVPRQDAARTEAGGHARFAERGYYL